MALRVLVVGLLALGLAATSACGSSGDARRVARVAPARLAPARIAHQAAVRTARARVHATAAYQAQNLRWRERIGDDIDLANQYLVPAFGLRIEVVEALPWDYQGDDDDLSAMLDALARTDPGDDVDWVVGMGSALSSTTTSFRQLGLAHVMGRHLVLRGFEDMDADALLDELDQSARDRVREARRQHRQATALLHEWAHTLGAMHVQRPTGIMAPSYSRKITGFAPQTAGLVAEMLPVWLAPRGQRSRAAMAAALRRYIETHPNSGWSQDERDQVMEMLAEEHAAGPASPAGVGPGAEQSAETAAEPAAGRGAGVVPGEARTAYAQVQTLHREGRHAQARAALDELIAAYPAHVEFRLAACRLHLDQAGPDPDALATCGRVGEIEAVEIGGDIMAATALIRAERRAEAGAVLADARDRVAAASGQAPARATGTHPGRDPVHASGEHAGHAPAAPDQPPHAAAGAWQALLAAYRGLDAVTWAEQAVAMAPAGVDTSAVSAWAAQTRRRYGLPPGSARGHRIPPEDEGLYLATVREVLAQVYRGDHAGAQRAARQALARYRGAPGLHGALCDLEMRRKRHAAARTHCRKAVAGYDEATWPRYLLGILELRARRNAAGIGHLERAIALDPDLRQAYHALAQAYERTGDEAARERLAEAYQARFGQPMPR